MLATVQRPLSARLPVSEALVHGGWSGDEVPTSIPLQADRTETGLAVRIMRLSTLTARATSPC